MTPVCTALPTETARAYRSGAPDANGMSPERAVSDGGGNPCRHCLRPQFGISRATAHRRWEYGLCVIDLAAERPAQRGQLPGDRPSVIHVGIERAVSANALPMARERRGQDGSTRRRSRCWSRVRRALGSAGFRVERRPGFGGKREMLRGGRG